MPRPAKKATTSAEHKVKAEGSTAKKRKAYPDRSERIAMADERIKRLEKLNADRAALVEKTEQKLNERKDLLEKSTKKLEDAIELRNRLQAAKDRPARNNAVRAVKAAEKAQLEALKAKLEAQGKTLEDLLMELG